MAMIRTVSGSISAEEMGKVLIHEHFVFGYPGSLGDSVSPYERRRAVEAGIRVAEQVKKFGVRTIVDATPNDCGRDPEVLREIAEKTGLNIVCATGYYYEGEGAPHYFRFRKALGSDLREEIYELFMKEITVGIGDTGIKAGVIKLASSKGVITDYEEAFFRAAARAQKETGVPIITHTSEDTMGPEQAELLLSEGADPNRIMIGHMDNSTSIAYHVRTLEKGVYLGFDRFGIQGLVGTPMDSHRVACLLGLIGLGYGNRIMLSHDSIAFWLGRPLKMSETVQALLKNWHPAHIFEDIIPQLRKAGVSEEQINMFVEKNPQSFFAGR